MLIPKFVEPQIVLTKKLSLESALFSSARLKADVSRLGMATPWLKERKAGVRDVGECLLSNPN